MREWWHPLFVGRKIQARMGAVPIAAGNKLFVFGGFAHTLLGEDGFSRRETDHIYTYSVARYSGDARAWVWEVSDAPYPAAVGNIRFDGGVSLLRSAQIVLVPEATPDKVR